MADVTSEQLPTVGRRVAGQIISGALAFVATIAATGLAGGDGSGLAVVYLLLGPGYLALEIVLLRTYGGHVGHLVLGMRAVTDDGSWPSWSQAAMRVAAFVLLPLYLIQLVVYSPLLEMLDLAWTIVLLVSITRDPQRRGWHDRAAGTTVVLVPKRA